MNRIPGPIALALLLACQTRIVPASRVTGIVVTPEETPIEGALVEAHLAVPVGVDGGETQELGTARSRGDGTFEIEFVEREVLVNRGENVLYVLQAVHPDRDPVGTTFDVGRQVPIRLPLALRPPGRDPIKDDCLWLCGPRLRHQCKAISLEYFGSEDVCDFRY